VDNNVCGLNNRSYLFIVFLGW